MVNDVCTTSIKKCYYLNAAVPIERIGLPSKDVQLIRSKFAKDFDGKPRNVFPSTSISTPSVLLEYPPNNEFSFSKRLSSLTVPLAKKESEMIILKDTIQKKCHPYMPSTKCDYIWYDLTFNLDDSVIGHVQGFK